MTAIPRGRPVTEVALGRDGFSNRLSLWALRMTHIRFGRLPMNAEPWAGTGRFVVCRWHSRLYGNPVKRYAGLWVGRWLYGAMWYPVFAIKEAR